MKTWVGAGLMGVRHQRVFRCVVGLLCQVRDTCILGSSERHYFLFLLFPFLLAFSVVLSFSLLPPVNAKARFLPIGVLAYQSEIK